MKKIGLLTLGRRGAAAVDTLEIAKTLVKENKIYLILSNQIENMQDYLILQKDFPNNVEIYSIDTYTNKIEFLIKSLNFFRFFIIAKKIEKKQLDFIYIPMISYWGAIVSILLKKQTIVTAIHDPEMHIGESDKLFSILTKKCVSKSHNLVVFSKQYVKIVSEKYNFPEEKICNLRLGGYSYYAKNKNKRNEVQRFNKILFFGRISEYKGLSVLLEAMKKMKSNGSNIILRIVGNGNLSDKEKQLITELGSSVELVNRWIKDEEVESFFEDIDFTVLPYIEATQSGIVMLSYAMQKPVIATNVGALSEQILEGETGFLIRPNNPDELVESIESMYNNNVFLLQGQKAFFYATQEWTWKKQVENLLTFLK